jgi:hypothetical protein
MVLVRPLPEGSEKNHESSVCLLGILAHSHVRNLAQMAQGSPDKSREGLTALFLQELGKP